MSNKVNLIVDIGNTTIVFGFFEKEKIISRVTFKTHLEKEETLVSSLSNFKNFEVEDGMIFSVVPSINKLVQDVVKKIFEKEITVFDWEHYELENKDPKITDKIGADLLADIVEVTSKKKFPALIFDLGTVTKLIEIDEKGNLSGCSFIPGLQIMLSSFFGSTECLPKIDELDLPNIELGKDTISSMKHGVYWATVSFIEKQIENHKNIENLNVFITGGNTISVSDYFKKYNCDINLTLNGMNLLFIEAQK